MTVGPDSVTLLAHLSYYRHAAGTLDDAGLLHRYLTLPFSTHAVRGAGWPGIGPAVTRFNETRVFPDLDGVATRRLWLGQLGDRLARGSRADRVGASLRARSLAWDLDATAELARPGHGLRGSPPVLHFASGIGLHAARRARRQGAIVVCDVRASHHRARLAAVAPALARHGVDFRLPNEANLPRLEAEFDLADLLICNSAFTRSTFLDAGFAEDRVVSLPLGCATEQFVPAAAPPDAFTVLFVGRQRFEKGFLDLAAAARVLGAGDRLVVSGGIDARSAAAVAGLQATTEFVGPVTAQRVPELYRRASVLVFPSLSDGFGLVVLEAMASGLAVIVSDHTGAAELVEDGVNGFVVPAGDAEALADRLRALAADPDRCATMGIAARRTAAGRTWRAYGDRLLAIYRDHVGSS